MWHVLHTQPRRELQVARLLSHEDIDSYIPEFPSAPRTKVGSKRDQLRQRLFPGYMFFRVPEDFVRWEQIRWAPGVRRVLHVDGSPGVIPDAVVDHIRERLADKSLRAVKPRFERGETVVVERGALAAVDAIFDRELDSASRVQILVNMMGRSLPVHIDLEDLSKAAS
jgi:transcription elongation factor/antiterminator RfaH